MVTWNMGKYGANGKPDADDTECQYAEPQYHQKVNNILGLHFCRNGLSKCK